MIKQFVKKVLPDILYEQLVMQYVRIRDAVLIAKCEKQDKEKYDIISKIYPYTMVGFKGLSSTYDVVKRAKEEGIEGCMVECGVAKGGCSLLMGLVDKDRKLWMFDSFEGLPEHSKEDTIVSKRSGNKGDAILRDTYCYGNYEEVKRLVSGFELKEVEIIKGWFNDTLPDNNVGDIAILRIDADWYESTKCVLENLYNKVVKGGFVIVDDYALPGCRKAVDEFVKADMVYDGRGGVYFRK